MKIKSLLHKSISFLLFSLFMMVHFSIGFAQDDVDSDTPALTKARQLVNRLSPEEKVGQLFLITFDGNTIEEGSEIESLVKDFHIGGVVLTRDNDNFTGSDTVINDAFQLIYQLQNLEYAAANLPLDSDGVTTLNDYIPLFIGVSQGGDGFPLDQILSGVTGLPSPMAIGATWDVELAQNTGEVLGREMNSIGFNLLFGPTLDLSISPASPQNDNLSTESFGGDPFWVGEMGKAFISGIKVGSKDSLIVIAKHFPGIGSSDRSPLEEVATVRKSLEQLKLYELAPFSFAAQLSRIDGTSLVDGFLVSHIRYQGFQGNIRATTKPVSFDSTALNQLMSLPDFSDWRETGGLLVSEDLGSEAVRKFFNPTNQIFDARQIARSSFLAGNDLLYMDNLISSNAADRFESYKSVLTFFVQKYKEDKAFAAVVDDSLLRILTKKYQLYPEFDIDLVLSRENLLTGIGNHYEVVLEVASKGSTLINPGKEQLIEILPDPPAANDRILVFTDALSVRQCSECEIQPEVPINGLGNALINLYGPSGSGEIFPQNILSYGFDDLNGYLEKPFNWLELETNVSRSNWIIFVTTGESLDSSRAMRSFLSEKANEILDKKVVLFALGPPYYLDATEISSFSAVYCLYSKSEQFLDYAARILFKEFTPVGASPVSIPAISYDLISVTSPNPDQIIGLFVDETNFGASENGDLSSQNQENKNIFQLGDNLPIQTGIIVDYNGHPVPDGTVVRFTMNLIGENINIQQVESFTQDGIARALMLLQNPGLHEIRAVSEPAQSSQILQVDISEETGTIISAISPTPLPDLRDENVDFDSNDSQSKNSLRESKSEQPVLRWLTVLLSAWMIGAIFFVQSGFIPNILSRAKMALVIIIGTLTTGLLVINFLDADYFKFGFMGFLTTIILSLGGGIIFGGFFWMIKTRLD